MKKAAFATLAFVCFLSVSCRVGRGCRGNGKNVGAERILSGDPKTMKEVKKAGKFKM